MPECGSKGVHNRTVTYSDLEAQLIQPALYLSQRLTRHRHLLLRGRVCVRRPAALLRQQLACTGRG
jgi:hypothetical protein